MTKSFCVYKLGFFYLRRRLRPHEAHLSTVALSNVESSRTIGQILHDMNDMKDMNDMNDMTAWTTWMHEMKNKL